MTLRPNEVTFFAALFDYHMGVRGHTNLTLSEAIRAPTDFDRRSFGFWRVGKTKPQQRKSLALLRKVEDNFGLPEGYFARSLLLGRSPSRQNTAQVNPSQQRAFRWHLPEDFDERSPDERQEILSWVSANVLPCTTEYGKYQKQFTRNPFAVVFPELVSLVEARYPRRRQALLKEWRESEGIPEQ